MIVRSAHAASEEDDQCRDEDARDRPGWHRRRTAAPAAHASGTATTRRRRRRSPGPAHISHCAARTAPEFTASSVTSAPGGSRRLWMRRAITHQTTPTETRIRAGNARWKAPAKTSSPSAISSCAEQHDEGAQGHEEAHEEGQRASHPDATPQEDDREQVEAQPEGAGDAQARAGQGVELPRSRRAMLTRTQVETPARKRCHAWTPRRSRSNPSSSSHSGLGRSILGLRDHAVTFASS